MSLDVIAWFLRNHRSSFSLTLEHIHQLHGFLIQRGLYHNNLLIARFIEACSSLGHSLYAKAIFSRANRPDSYLFTTITNQTNLLSPSEALSLYTKTRPDSFSVPSALKAVADLSAVETGRQIHCQAIAAGLSSGAHVVAALVRMYSLCGLVSDALKVFDEMPHRNLVSWTRVVSGFARAKRPREACVVFKRMMLENVEPDGVAMLSLISACAQLGSLELGKRIHGYVLKLGFYKNNLLVKNSLVDMYAKSGSVAMARDVFESVGEERNVVTYTTMIAGLALHGLGSEATEIFSLMEGDSVKPNKITFIALLSACSHAGLVETGRWYFDNMASRYGVRPKIEHYGCVVDLLGRAGHLDEARELVRAMPFEANSAIWGSLLSASKIHGDAELGEQALERLMVLEPRNSGNYTILSNIYSSLGGWDESGMLKKAMRDAGVKKTPGGSSLEVNNRVHWFVAGDASNPEFLVAFKTVREIFNQVKIVADLQTELIEFLELHE